MFLKIYLVFRLPFLYNESKKGGTDVNGQLFSVKK